MTDLDKAALLAERVRRELDEMNFYEGTQRRDACIARAILEAIRDEREANDRILADMQVDSRAWQAGYERGKVEGSHWVLGVIKGRLDVVKGLERQFGNEPFEAEYWRHQGTALETVLSVIELVRQAREASLTQAAPAVPSPDTA